jgi:hypothetical protein
MLEMGEKSGSFVFVVVWRRLAPCGEVEIGSG